MANTVIQLKQSLITAAPTRLNVGEPAYSFVSNTLFIGTPAGTGVIEIGGLSAVIFTQQAFEKANLGIAHAQSGFTQANAGIFHAQTAFIQANAAIFHAQTGFAQANAGIFHAQTAYNQANAGFIQANAGILHAQSAFREVNASSIQANSGIFHAQSAFIQANAGIAHAQSAFDIANAGFIQANAGILHAQSAFIQANAGIFHAQSAFIQANAGIIHAQSAFNQANAGFTQANAGILHAQSAFTQANSNYISAVTRLSVTNSGVSAYLLDQYPGNNPTIYVRAGETIAFDLNVTGHPFMIRLSSGGANYNTGLIHVATNGTVSTTSSAQGKVSGILYWKVPFDIVGSTYVYQCSIHGGMVGNIVIEQPTIVALNMANAAYSSQNTTGQYANSAFIQANAGILHAQSGFIQANSGIIHAQSAFNHANAAFISANNVAPQVQPAFNTANAAFIQANAGILHAQSAFIRANNSLNANVGGQITGDVTITGNLVIIGNTVYANTQTVLIADNIITLNAAINQASPPTMNAGIEVDRGSSANVYLLWNEGTTSWQFTNDGTTYENFGGGSAGVYANGAFIHANAAFAFANTISGGSAIDNVARAIANSTGIYANAAFIQANASILHAQSAFNQANAAFIVANTANAAAANGGSVVVTYATTPPATANANGHLWIDSNDGTKYTYFKDNDGFQWVELGPSSSNVTTNTFITANIASTFAQANAAYDKANAAFNQANTANGTITSNRLGSNLAINIIQVLETANIYPTAVGGNVNIDIGNNTSYFFSANTTANVTFNLRANGNAGGIYDSLVNIGQASTVALALKQGATRYKANLHIDGVLQTVYWLGNSAPDYATTQPQTIDVYSFVVFKTAANTYSVLAANSNFGLAQGQPGQG